jgi:hypothetical protein
MEDKCVRKCAAMGCYDDALDTFHYCVRHKCQVKPCRIIAQHDNFCHKHRCLECGALGDHAQQRCEKCQQETICVRCKRPTFFEFAGICFDCS